jgi:hypothetical protein
MNSASLCSLAGRYDNPIPPRFLDPIDSLKIPARNAEINHDQLRVSTNQKDVLVQQVCLRATKIILI